METDRRKWRPREPKINQWISDQSGIIGWCKINEWYRSLMNESFSLRRESSLFWFPANISVTSPFDFQTSPKFDLVAIRFSQKETKKWDKLHGCSLQRPIFVVFNFVFTFFRHTPTVIHRFCFYFVLSFWRFFMYSNIKIQHNFDFLPVILMFLYSFQKMFHIFALQKNGARIALQDSFHF